MDGCSEAGEYGNSKIWRQMRSADGIGHKVLVLLLQYFCQMLTASAVLKIWEYNHSTSVALA